MDRRLVSLVNSSSPSTTVGIRKRKTCLSVLAKGRRYQPDPSQSDREGGSVNVSCQLPSIPNTKICQMLTENRKRRRVGDNAEEQQLNPQAKRSGGSHDTLVSDLGRDVWDSEHSSSSDSSGVGISSPERAASASTGLCGHHGQNCISQNSLSPQPEGSASASLQGFHGDGYSSSSSSSSDSYHHINRVLREAHFNSLQTRERPGST